MKNKQFLHLLRNKMVYIKKLFSWHLAVKSKNRLFLPLLKVTNLIGVHTTKATVSSIYLLSKSIILLIKKNGTNFTCRYLKYSSLYLMKYVAGESLDQKRSSLFDIHISITKGGLPRIIPSFLRRQIRLGNPRLIKITLTIFGLYRVLPYRGSVKLSTITDPFGGYIPLGLMDFIPFFLKKLGNEKVSFT
jgi:hypothetical protein